MDLQALIDELTVAPVPFRRPWEQHQQQQQPPTVYVPACLQEYTDLVSRLNLVGLLPDVDKVLAWEYRAEDGDSWQAVVLPNAIVYPNWGPDGGFGWTAFGSHDEARQYPLRSGVISTDDDEQWAWFLNGCAEARIIGIEMDAKLAEHQTLLNAQPTLDEYGLLPVDSVYFAPYQRLHLAFQTHQVTMIVVGRYDSISVTLTPDMVAQVLTMFTVTDPHPSYTGDTLISLEYRGTHPHLIVVRDTESVILPEMDAISDPVEGVRTLLQAWVKYRSAFTIWHEAKQRTFDELVAMTRAVQQ